jgi:LysM repeat protein
MPLTIVTRKQWGAVAPSHRSTIATPTPSRHLHHSPGSGADESKILNIPRFHMAPPPEGRGWADIAYSVLVDDDVPDVDVFEGRGAGVAGGHTKGQNTVSHAICVVGDFTARAPHDATLAKIAELVAHGHRLGWWPLEFTGGHRDAPGAATTCPGDALHRLIPELDAEARRLFRGGGEDTSETASSYVVQRGDTMSRIAARFGLSLRSLVAANPELPNPHEILPGQVINLAARRGGSTPPTGITTFTYVVQSGDTMTVIATKFRLPLSGLVAANPQISDPDRIFRGQLVLVPSG